MSHLALPAGAPPLPDLQRTLLAWFDAHRRDLPWRRRRSLYGTWISEMMLQQTTVATVVPYWERFLERFPDVAALAAAPEPDVLAAWSGLGYYRRARQLHAAARRLADQDGGRLPRDAAGWRELPGVGPYAAGAIASLGLGLPEPAVDANVRRVLGRWLGAGAAPASPRALEELARSLVSPDRPGDWNEALMELGATLCGPRAPACGSCPLGSWCATGRDGPPRDVPAAARPEAQPVRAALLVVWRGGRLWLEPAGGPAIACPGGGPVARDDFTRLHQGLLTLPMTAWYAATPAARPVRGARAGAGAGRGRAPASALEGAGDLEPDWRPWPGVGGAWSRVGRFRHAITRFRLAVDVLVADDPAPPPPPGPGPSAGAPAGSPPHVGPEGRPDGRWATPAEAEALAVSQLTRKALRLLPDGRG